LISDGRVVDLQRELEDMRAASEFDAAEAAERSSTITVLKRGLTEADVANTDLEAQISTADVEITRMLAVEETLMTRVNVLSEQVAAAEEALQESSAHGHEHDVEPRERLEAAADLKERYGSMRKQYQARIAELEAQLEDDGRQTSPAHRPYFCPPVHIPPGIAAHLFVPFDAYFGRPSLCPACQGCRVIVISWAPFVVLLTTFLAAAGCDFVDTLE
jgi:hypothetical protein